MMQETTSRAVHTDPSSAARNWHGTNIQDLRLVLLAVSASISLPVPPTPFKRANTDKPLAHSPYTISLPATCSNTNHTQLNAG